MKLDPRLQRRGAEWLAKHGWRVQRTVDGKPNPALVWDEDPEFLRVFEPVHRLTLVTPAAAYVLAAAVRQTGHLGGALAEVGVYQGGTAKLIADLTSSTSHRPKPLHLFDTFTGMPATDPRRDIHVAGDFADTSVEKVAALFPPDAVVHLHPGYFPASATAVERTEFCLVHIDVDIYQSVLDACRFFYPLIVAGGVMLFDDYGWTSCPGAREAVDEFFAGRREQPIYLPTGQALVVKLSEGAPPSV